MYTIESLNAEHWSIRITHVNLQTNNNITVIANLDNSPHSAVQKSNRKSVFSFLGSSS